MWTLLTSQSPLSSVLCEDEYFPGSCGGWWVSDGYCRGASQEEGGAEGSSDDGNNQPRVWMDPASGHMLLNVSILNVFPACPLFPVFLEDQLSVSLRLCINLLVLSHADHRTLPLLDGSRVWTESLCWQWWTCSIQLGWAPSWLLLHVDDNETKLLI